LTCLGVVVIFRERWKKHLFGVLDINKTIKLNNC
jgi:hypothetical protein